MCTPGSIEATVYNLGHFNADPVLIKREQRSPPHPENFLSKVTAAYKLFSGLINNSRNKFFRKLSELDFLVPSGFLVPKLRDSSLKKVITKDQDKAVIKYPTTDPNPEHSKLINGKDTRQRPLSKS